MPRKALELGPLSVSRLTQPGLHMVGGVAGLALQVLPSGGRTWILRATIGNRRREMGLGGFPDVTLAQAREAAREARALIRRGIDPIEAGKEARRALKEKPLATMSFRSAAEAYIASHQASWKNLKHRTQWTSTLEMYVYPMFGDMDVVRIELPPPRITRSELRLTAHRGEGKRPPLPLEPCARHFGQTVGRRKTIRRPPPRTSKTAQA